MIELPGAKDNGLLVRPDDGLELTRAVGALAGDANLRLRLGKAGQVAVHNQASPETFVLTQMQAYARAARRHRRPMGPPTVEGG